MSTLRFNGLPPVAPVTPNRTTPLGFGPDIARFGAPQPAPHPAMAPAPVPGFAPSGSAMSSGITDTLGAGIADAAGAAGAGTGWQGWGNLAKSTLFNKEGGLDLENIGSLAQTIGAFGNMWGAFQANKIAKDSLNFSKDAYDTNLTNTISSYNLGLEDRIRSRAVQENRGAGYADRYIDKHKLER